MGLPWGTWQCTLLTGTQMEKKTGNDMETGIMGEFRGLTLQILHGPEYP